MNTKTTMKTKKYFKIASLVLLFIMFFIILGACFYAFSVVKDQKLDKNAIESKAGAKIKIFDSEGQEMEYYSPISNAISFEELSPYTILAFVSLEDKRFFEHKGIDVKRMGGALINNIKAGYFKEGGSTITQQLVKNALLNQEKTIDRKLKEVKLALEVEKEFSKEEIITKYLNTIYFGHSLYGIKDASNRLFNKEPKDLSIGESAILAGIVKNPLKNSPLNSIDNAISRRNLVLRLMREQNHISEQEYEIALNEKYFPPTVSIPKKKNIPYTQVVIEESAKALGISERELITNEYKIYTYFDENSQNAVEIAYNSHDLQAGDHKTFLLSNNENGGICAYVSTVNYSPYTFRRQGASTLKPFLAYAPALEKGLVLPESPILDEKYEYKGYTPNNFQSNYLGWTTVRESLITSSNACSLKLLSQVGLDYALDLGTKCGLHFNEKDSYASVLGGTTEGQTNIELLEAYMSLANGGEHQNASFIKAIYDDTGKEVYSHNPLRKRVFSQETAYFITDMLISCSKKGTARKLSSLDFEVASKTGTNGNESGNFDAWNASYTTSHTLISWYGSSDYLKPMPLAVTGGSYPTLGAKCILASLPTDKKFTFPNTLEYAQIDGYSYEHSHVLSLANEDTPDSYRRSVLISEKFIMPTSDYFSHSIPNDFEVMSGDGEVIATFSKNKKFYYVLENSCGDMLAKIEKGSGKVEITLPKPNLGLEFYYLSAYTEDKVLVKTSTPKMIFSWY